MAQQTEITAEMLSRFMAVARQIRSVGGKDASLARAWVGRQPKGFHQAGKTYTVYAQDGEPVAHGGYQEVCQRLKLKQSTFSCMLTRYRKGIPVKYIFSVVEQEE